MASLKERFEEIIHKTWSEFLEIEKNQESSIDDAVLYSLIRICADTDDIAAINMAFDRIDGMLETPISVNVPKFYIRYVNAKEVEGGYKAVEAPKNEKKVDYDPATAKLRETLREMRNMPQHITRVVLGYKKAIEQGKKLEHDPMVKSVIVANLLKNVKKGKFRAIELVFNQIDGKLTRTITLLGGEDVYIDDYNTLIAPAGATKDENGYYIAENQLMTNQWLRGFANSQKGLEMLAEGLDSDEYRS
jgi:hypothetical protein